MKLFVYGTLMQGQPNHPLLGSGCTCEPCLDHVGPFGPVCQCQMCISLGSLCMAQEATLVTTGYVEGSLLHLGRFPMAIDNPGHWIKGEVYEVDEAQLEVIDELESYFGPKHPANMYERVIVPLSFYNRKVSNARQRMDVLVYFGARLSLIQDWHDARL